MALNTGTYSTNEEVIFEYLKHQKYNLAQICGILANIEAECQFNHKALNEKELAWGLCQWRSSRRQALFNRYKKYINTDIRDQVLFIAYEMNTTESTAKEYMDSVSNNRTGAYNAGYYFAKYYERCHESYHISRADRAQEYWDYYTTNTTDITPKIDDSDDPDIPDITDIATQGPVSGIVDPASTVSATYSRVTAVGSDYGYLIDMTYGGEFKFYVPEFSEAAGANWEDIVIPGRSSTIKSYSNTNSRAITVSLDLYAGVGLYDSKIVGEDVVGAMHSDINFVKSLEYPDYNLSVARPPATVHLSLGSAVSLDGVVSGVSVEHMKPLDSQNRSMYVKLSFTVTQVIAEPQGWNDIRGVAVTVENTGDQSLSTSTTTQETSDYAANRGVMAGYEDRVPSSVLNSINSSTNNSSSNNTGSSNNDLPSFK